MRLQAVGRAWIQVHHFPPQDVERSSVIAVFAHGVKSSSGIGISIICVERIRFPSGDSNEIMVLRNAIGPWLAFALEVR